MEAIDKFHLLGDTIIDPFVDLLSLGMYGLVLLPELASLVLAQVLLGLLLDRLGLGLQFPQLFELAVNGGQ